jgi:excisionase family DNA binding protein
MEQVQFIQTTPQQIETAIIAGVKVQIDLLKKEFQPKIPTEYLTRNEVKELLSVDLSTIHNWQKKGKLRAYGIGARVYYKRHEVEQAIKPINF